MKPSQLYIWYPDLPTLESDVRLAGYRITGFKGILKPGDIYLARSSVPGAPRVEHRWVEPFNYTVIHLRPI